MGQRHARACFAFNRIHKERPLKMFDDEYPCEAPQHKLGEKSVAWLPQDGYKL